MRSYDLPQTGLTKNQSSALYGVAILMMLFHHLFGMPSRLPYEYKSLLGGNIEQKMAWFCKICVAIYAFISGYGLSASMGQESNIFDMYKRTGKKAVSLMRKYWLVFFLFLPGIMFFDQRNGGYQSPQTLIRSFLGLDAAYNSAWWYVQQYLVFLIEFPIFQLLLKRKKSRKEWRAPILLISFIVIGVVLVQYYTGIDMIAFCKREYILSFYTYIFLIGMVIYRFGIFKMVDNLLEKAGGGYTSWDTDFLRYDSNFSDRFNVIQQM